MSKGHSAQVWRFAALVVVCIALAGCDSKGPTTEGKSPRRIFALGRLEPATGVRSITGIPGERLQKLDADVRVNSPVPANGVLGVLASHELGKERLGALKTKKSLIGKKHEQETLAVEAQLAQAKAAQAEAKAKQEIIPFEQKKIALLETASKLAKDEYDRLVNLKKSDSSLVSQPELDEKKNEMELAEQELVVAREKLSSAEEVAKKAIAAADKNVSLAELATEQLDGKQAIEEQALEQEISAAKALLKRSFLLSPHVSPKDLSDIGEMTWKAEHADEPNAASDDRPFTVLRILLQEGETITQSPILELGDLSEMVCVAEVYEADVQHIQHKPEVTISSTSFSGDLRGKVVDISRMVAAPSVDNRNPLAPVDRKVVEVRIKIEDEDALELARKFVGLEVTVEFDAKPDQQSPQQESSDQR